MNILSLNLFKPLNRLYLVTILMNVILAIYFSISHILTTHHILDWQELFSFQGPNPFQSRILPFAVGHLIFQLFSFKTIYVKLLFIIYDFTSSLLAIFYLHKIIKIYYPNYSALLITCKPLWVDNLLILV